MYRLQLFGQPQLFALTGDVIPIGRRARGILCYLALAQDQKATRERLCTLFWSDRGAPQARASLRQTLLQLRRALPLDGLDPLSADRACISLNPAAIATDIHAAETAKSVDELLELLRVIGDEPLVDLRTFGVEFEKWRSAIRPVVEARLRTAVLRQIDAAQAGGDHVAIIAVANAWAVRDPLDEIVAAHAFRSEILSGARNSAERRYQALSNRLECELGVQPDQRLFALLQPPKGGDPSDNSVSMMVAPAVALPVVNAPAEPMLEFAEPPKGWLAFKTTPVRYATAVLGVVLLGVAGSLALAWMRPLAAAEKPVLAVLPFKTVNGGTDDAIFAEGLAEEVMNGLAEDDRISVLGSATTLRLSTTPSFRSEAYERLGVTRLLTGTLTYGADGSPIEVKVDLIDSQTGTSKWTKKVSLGTTDFASAEHELVNLVAREVLGEPNARRSLSGPKTKLDASAYRKIVVARRHILSREGDRLIEARELARQAIKIAPRWAEAHAVRSIAASLVQNYTDMPVEPLQEEAIAAAARAIALDPELSAAHEAQSFALEAVNPRQAMSAARWAVQLRPRNAEVRRRLAWLLRADGQFRQAAEELETAIQIDPLWHLPYIDLGMSLYQMNEPGKMIAWQARHEALKPLTKERDLVLANMLLDTERAGEAAPIAARLVRNNPKFTYAALTWIDTMIALYAADDIPDALFELNSSPLMVALARGDLKGAADANQDGAVLWGDPEGAVILGYALMANGQPGTLRALLMARYPRPEDHMRRPSQTLAFHRHPDLYAALAYAAAGDAAGSKAIRRKIAEDVARFENQGLAMSQSGVTVAALALMDGNRSAALDRLESAMSAQWTVVCHGPIWLGSDPLFRPLARDPRFEALQKRCRARLDQQRLAAGLGPALIR